MIGQEERQGKGVVDVIAEVTVENDFLARGGLGLGSTKDKSKKEVFM
nr:hypothetical protein [Haliscomenobacter sp.]